MYIGAYTGAFIAHIIGGTLDTGGSLGFGVGIILGPLITYFVVRNALEKRYWNQ